jgi:hypothetical protein
MHKIVRKDEQGKTFLDMGIGEFFEIETPQETLDGMPIVLHTGDVFIRTESHEWVCISTNDKSATERSNWIGSKFDFTDEELEGIEGRIFKPKDIVFYI